MKADARMTRNRPAQIIADTLMSSSLGTRTTRLTQTTCANRGTTGSLKLVGHDHPSVWLLIDAMRKEAVVAMTDIERDDRLEPPLKRVKKATRALQLRVQRICVARRDNQKTVAQTLSAAGHTIRFA